MRAILVDYLGVAIRCSDRVNRPFDFCSLEESHLKQAC